MDERHESDTQNRVLPPVRRHRVDDRSRPRDPAGAAVRVLGRAPGGRDVRGRGHPGTVCKLQLRQLHGLRQRLHRGGNPGRAPVCRRLPRGEEGPAVHRQARGRENPPGRGNAARGNAESNLQGAFEDTRQLLASLRHGDEQKSRDEAKVYERIIDAELLVLDDIGAERRTTWVEDTLDRLETIVIERYNAKRPTIFTTNYFDNDDAIEGLGVRIGQPPAVAAARDVPLVRAVRPGLPHTRAQPASEGDRRRRQAHGALQGMSARRPAAANGTAVRPLATIN